MIGKLSLLGALTKPPEFPVLARLSRGGSLAFDRPLPLVCLHDRKARQEPLDHSLELLTRGAPNHVILDGDAALQEARPMIDALLAAAVGDFGCCALVVLSEPADQVEQELPQRTSPIVKVRLHAPSQRERDAAKAFGETLCRRKVRGLKTMVLLGEPIGSHPLLDRFDQEGLSRIVLELDPIFYSRDVRKLRGLLLRDFAERLHPALNEMAYQLVDAKRQRSIQCAASLGRRHISAYVEEIEKGLAQVSQSFDLLLLLTPTNGEAAFQRFVAGGCQRRPEFLYRTIYIDPDELRRTLYQLPIERVDDPTLGRLLREQREHIDDQLSMVAHRNSPRCLYGSLHVYGSVEDRLYRVARGIAEAFMPDEDEQEAAIVGADAFRTRVLQEFEHYRKQDSRFEANVLIRDDVTSLTVSEQTLLVPRTTALSERRTEALLAHEVGVHLLTHHNGKSQPLELMRTGLAGYDQLQEGLAVIGEYLAGGLTPQRLRLLAARVIAVRQLLSGAEFIDVFREVSKTFGLPDRHAFFVAMRVFRAGGFTKDAIYLRGVLEVLEHLRQRRSFEELLLGKYSALHAPLVQELRWRKVLKPPALLPRVLKSSGGKRRLSALMGQPRTVFDLCQREAP